MDGEDLSKILCLLEPGMSLTVPDAWIDRILPGTLRHRAACVDKLGLDYGCVWRQGNGVQTFEKLEIPATG